MGKSILTSSNVAGFCIVNDSGDSGEGTSGIGAGGGICWAFEGNHKAPITKDRITNLKRHAKRCMLQDYLNFAAEIEECLGVNQTYRWETK
jgi:hypothetical protein